jgi:hypothetical protein
MTRRGWWLAVVFAVWTLVVWGTRIDNVLADDTLSTGGQVWRLALALSLVVPAAVLLALLLRQRRGAERVSGAPSAVLTALVAWTVVVWVVRVAGIVSGDRSAGFVAVHVGLALGSVALGAVALRTAGRGRRSRAPAGAGRG